MLTKRRLHFVSAMIIAAMMATTFVASSADPALEAHRTELYREGIAAGDKGDWVAAAKKFREVVAIRSAPKAVIALAVAEERSGHLAESKRLYARALADAHEGGTSHADEARAANEALTRIAPLVPRVTPLLPKDISARGYTVDGNKLDLQDGALEVDVGAHNIDIESSDGASHFTKSITVKEGDRLNVWVVFVPVEAVAAAAPGTAPTDTPAPPPKPTQPDPVAQGSSSSLPLGPIIVAGVGVVASGVGAVFWGLGRSSESDAKDQCGGRTTNCPPSAKSTVDSGHTKIVVGNVAFIAGLAVIAGGVVWWLISPSSSPKQTAIAKHLCQGAVCF